MFGKKVTPSKLKDKEEFLEAFRELLNGHGVDRELDLEWLIPEVKKTIIQEVMIPTRGNQARAARWLGINRGTLHKILVNPVKLKSQMPAG